MEKKKLLIIGGDSLAIQALEGACKSFVFFDEIVKCSHDAALFFFRQEKPTHLIINEYDESKQGMQEGAYTWESLLELITSEVVVLSGRENYNIPNYIRLPFELLQLKKFLIG